MAVVFDQKSESGFVFGSVLEFIKCWEAGADSRLVIESHNGRAWLNFSCSLGTPKASHVVPKRQKSPRKEFKDNLRAAAYNEKVRGQSCSGESSDNTDDDMKNDAGTARTMTTEAVDANKVLECSVNLYSNDIEPSEESIEDVKRVIERTVLNFVKTFEDEYDIEVQNLNSDDVTAWETYSGSGQNMLEQKIRVNYRQKGKGEDFAKSLREKSRSEKHECFMTEALIEGEMVDLDDGIIEIYFG